MFVRYQPHVPIYESMLYIHMFVRDQLHGSIYVSISYIHMFVRGHLHGSPSWPWFFITKKRSCDKIKRALHEAPPIAGSGQGWMYTTLYPSVQRLFPCSNLWPSSHSVATLLLCQGSPSKKKLWYFRSKGCLVNKFYYNGYTKHSKRIGCLVVFLKTCFVQIDKS